MQTKTRNAREHDQVVRWRRDQLVDAGFPRALAAMLAENPHYDLHALIELVERGCRPDLAVRILAPVDAESAA
jgi:hypothetical protein